MSESTAISWCDSTVNFWQGCTKVSPACDNCYAERRNRWLHKGENWGPGAPRLLHQTAPATVRSWQRNAEKFRKAHGRDRRVFVNSTSDWLDNEVPIDWLVTLLDTVRQSPDVTFLLLTKRIGNWRKRLDEARNAAYVGAQYDLAGWIGEWQQGRAPANVWLGDTICNQEEADRDIPKLLAVPARVRFLSIEPMLGLVDLRGVPVSGSGHSEADPIILANVLKRVAAWPRLPQIDWVICGGESGPQSRPMHPDWVRSLRDQCAAAGVPFHFKQWGEWRVPVAGETFNTSMGRDQRVPAFIVAPAGTVHCFENEATRHGGRAMVRVGTKAAGRLLDGIEHNGFPA